jgi:apolipoprotein N-acyltransferase
MRRLIGIWLLVILGGVLFEVGYFRWWVTILITPLPIALAFALCRNRGGCLLFALVGGFLALRIQQDKLATYDHLGATILIFLSALTLVPVAWAIHEAVRRNYRMVWVLPVAWVGAETLRLIGPLGLPFAVLGFACHEQVVLVQIADIGGPLLLSFAIAAANGAILDFILARGKLRQRFLRAFLPGGLAIILLWTFLLGYGQIRIRMVDAALESGLRIAVVQSDALSFSDPSKNYDGHVLLAELMAMSEEAANSSEPPDLIVWPEKAADIPLYNAEFLEAEFNLRMVPESLRTEAKADPTPFIAEWERFREERRQQQLAFQLWVNYLGIPVLAGLNHQLPGKGEFPNYFDSYNAATLFAPDQRDGAEALFTQFKMRLFPGGEYMPGGTELWLKWLGWLPAARAWIESVGDLETGNERVLMEWMGTPFVVALCSEILRSVDAGVFESAPDGRQPLIVTISNEGRFHRNHSLMVSKMAMPFRSVEARTSVARAANAGISGFTDPVGRYYGLVRNEDGKHFTRLGAPDSEAIDAVLAFINMHEVETIARDPLLLAEYQRLLAEVERLRSLAGIKGYSNENTSTTSIRTIYQRGGHYFPFAVLGIFILFLLFSVFSPIYLKLYDKNSC